MKTFIPVRLTFALLLGFVSSTLSIEPSAASASPAPGPYPDVNTGLALELDQGIHVVFENPHVNTGLAPGAPKKPAVPGKKWVHPTFKGAQGAGWIQVPDKPAVPTTGPAASAPRGSEIVGDHWHWPGDYMTVLHGERWGRAGRLGTWKVPIRKVP